MLTKQLTEIANELEKLVGQFQSLQRFGRVLTADKAAHFYQLMFEVVDIVTLAMGPSSEYVERFRDFPYNDLGPDHADVLHAVSLIRSTVRQIDRTRAGQFSEQTSSAFPAPVALPPSPYVDAARIEQLSAIKSDNFDFTRLIQLCRELNIVDANDCRMATAMLVRAIVDHVPPVLGCKTFPEVASSYKGSRSFKEHMGNLENSLRKVADGFLHSHIRQREALPTPTTVRSFQAAVDELLGEVVRVSKGS